jgi:CheY-like chemotaxis protein
MSIGQHFVHQGQKFIRGERFSENFNGAYEKESFISVRFRPLQAFIWRMARILIVDDDPDTRDLLEFSLRLAGHETVTAPHGREGLKLFLANPVDLVITDLFMPEQNGLETITELLRRSPEVFNLVSRGRLGSSGTGYFTNSKLTPDKRQMTILSSSPSSGWQTRNP